MHLQVGTSLGSSSPACSATKKCIKEFLRINFSTTRAAKMKASVLKVEATRTSKWVLLLLLLKVGVRSSVTKLIVQLSLFVVTEGFVRCCCLFEFFSSRLIVLVWKARD
jgi:hypothetical protein